MSGWPRSITYFLLGIPVGVYFGFLCFHYRANADGTEGDITCLIIQQSKSLNSVNQSKLPWLSKCDNFLVVRYKRPGFNKYGSPKEGQCDADAGVVNISGKSGWGALCQALLLIPESTKWLLISPDTLLVIMENLREYLKNKDYRSVIYMGHPVKHYMAEYNAMSAGIVVSQGALSRVRERFPNKIVCENSGKMWKNEDVVLGAHIQQLGGRVEDTRDEAGRGRFHGYNVNTLLNPGKLFLLSDYFRKALYPVPTGMECCSHSLISIDTSDADHARLHYFLTYGIGRYGIAAPAQPDAKSQRSDSQEPAWVAALRDIGYTGPTDNITSQQYYDIWMKHISPDMLAEKIAKIVAP